MSIHLIKKEVICMARIIALIIMVAPGVLGAFGIKL